MIWRDGKRICDETSSQKDLQHLLETRISRDWIFPCLERRWFLSRTPSRLDEIISLSLYPTTGWRHLTPGPPDLRMFDLNMRGIYDLHHHGNIMLVYHRENPKWVDFRENARHGHSKIRPNAVKCLLLWYLLFLANESLIRRIMYMRMENNYYTKGNCLHTLFWPQISAQNPTKALIETELPRLLLVQPA